MRLNIPPPPQKKSFIPFRIAIQLGKGRHIQFNGCVLFRGRGNITPEITKKKRIEENSPNYTEAQHINT